MIIADLSIFPTSEGVSVSKYVKEAIKVIKASGLHYQTGGMSTTIEASDIETLFTTVRNAHQAIERMGVKRIYFVLKVDHRLDKDATIASKLSSLGKK